MNHGTNSSPKTEEGKIFRVADKVSMLHPELVRDLVNSSEERYKKDISFIRKTSAKIPDLLDNFER